MLILTIMNDVLDIVVRQVSSLPISQVRSHGVGIAWRSRSYDFFNSLRRRAQTLSVYLFHHLEPNLKLKRARCSGLFYLAWHLSRCCRPLTESQRGCRCAALELRKLARATLAPRRMF